MPIDGHEAGVICELSDDVAQKYLDLDVAISIKEDFFSSVSNNKIKNKKMKMEEDRNDNR